MSDKIRDNEAHQERYEIITAAFDRLDHLEQVDNYYLESIAILESLIADRLESFLEVGFKNLGSLLSALKKHQEDASEWQNIYSRLDRWRDERNQALHEMVKLEKDNHHEWQERYKSFKTTVEEGRTLFRDIDKIVKKEKRKKD